MKLMLILVGRFCRFSNVIFSNRNVNETSTKRSFRERNKLTLLQNTCIGRFVYVCHYLDFTVKRV